VERHIRLARFPQTKSFDTFDFAAQPSLNKALGSGADALRVDREAPELHCPRAIRHRKKRTRPWGWD